MNREAFRKHFTSRAAMPDTVGEMLHATPAGIWVAVGVVALAVLSMVVFLTTTNINLLGMLFR